MSLLGKLFSGSAGPSSRPDNPLDSTTEDHLTYSLLFPEQEALCHNEQVFTFAPEPALPTDIKAFDMNGDIDLEMRDVRVIIMQEATNNSGSGQVLFDSHPHPPIAPSLDRQASASGHANSSKPEGRRSISSPRKVSVGQHSRPVVIQQDPAPRVFGGGGAFDRRPQHNKGQMSYNETEGQRSAREHREEVNTISSCMFGISEMLAYKGTGTKVHILPSESKSSISGSYAADGSFGRSSMRGSKLAQSFTSENVNMGPTSAGFMNTSSPLKGSDRKKVLITRMFPVSLPIDSLEDGHNLTPTAPAHSADGAGYPFPLVGERQVEKKSQPKQKRTPQYAVGLIIHLPTTHPVPSAPTSRSSFRGPGSYNEQESFPSSFGSARRAGWTMLGHGSGVESLDSSFFTDVDDRIDLITQHWDIIMRTLSYIQAFTTASLLPLLKQADLNSPDPRNHTRTASASVSISGKRVDDSVPFKVNKTNSKLVQLTSNCLMPNQTIHKEVDSARQRIVSGLKAYQVITCQGRWGIWREEARTVGRWAGTRDQGFFFFNLLTGFLGTHTEWLHALGPSSYRRRHYQQHRAAHDEDISLPARTVIVSDNKLMARRLIFLLSAFLPANQPLPSARLHRPSTSTSFGPYSQSPPNYAASLVRDEALRRKFNKRHSVARAAYFRTTSFPAEPTSGLEIHHHERRPSDGGSIRTANLPIPGCDIGTRKSSAATTSTAAPVTTIPHFTTRRSVRGTGPTPRPGSSGSLATEDLMRSLKRDSIGQYSTISSDSASQNSRWGSMISGLWGSKRRELVNFSPPQFDDIQISDSAISTPHGNDGKLAELKQKKPKEPTLRSSLPQDSETRKSDSASVETAKVNSSIGQSQMTEQTVQAQKRVPDPTGAYESPVKTSIDSSNGIIDIDVQLPEYLSFETAVSSPSSSGYSFSTPGFGIGLDGFEHYSRAGPDADTTMNVAGWLPRYNPDFALQAIPAQFNDNYLEEVKESLRAEPTPTLSSTPNFNESRVGRWVDISSAIVADTTKFTIKHIRYQRLVKPVNVDFPTSPATDSRYGNVYSTSHLTPGLEAYDKVEERFNEEAIISMDDILIDAIERIIAQSGNSSSVYPSSSESCKSSPGLERSDTETRETKPVEVPRNECRKMVITALEDIVHDVISSREREVGSSEEIDTAGRIGGTMREKESFLREAVRTWLDSLESGD